MLISHTKPLGTINLTSFPAEVVNIKITCLNQGHLRDSTMAQRFLLQLPLLTPQSTLLGRLRLHGHGLLRVLRSIGRALLHHHQCPV